MDEEEAIDTGDIILIKSMQERHMVACAHDGYLYITGTRKNSVPISDCQLITKATSVQRSDALQRMAVASGTGHRPRCARERLGISDVADHD